MPHSPSKFISLNMLVHGWSLQGGEPPPMTLRHICNWAVCDAFPDRTFLFPNGEKVDLLDLHRAMRMVTGLGASINEGKAIELLQRTIVSIAGIEAFCSCNGVDPPQSIKTLTSSLRRLFDKPRYLSPPDCPKGAEVVAQLEAQFSANAVINTLKSILERHQGHRESNISEQANERWLCYVNLAESDAERSKDPEIQTELAALQHEWNNLKAASNGMTGLETPQAGEDGGAQSTERKKRASGRPTGSGSLERGDLELVAEMRSGIDSGEYLSIAAAARAVVSRAEGAGTHASREKRLTKRYSELYPI
jgi:hypothetical protein